MDQKEQLHFELIEAITELFERRHVSHADGFATLACLLASLLQHSGYSRKQAISMFGTVWDTLPFVKNKREH